MRALLDVSARRELMTVAGAKTSLPYRTRHHTVDTKRVQALPSRVEPMSEAVIVATARTPIGKAYRGAFNDTQGQALAGRAVGEAVRRAGIEPAEVGDVVLGCALQQGSTGFNVARQAALWAGLPDSVAGMTVDRQCGSGLMAIAIVAKGVASGELTIGVAGGVESISLVQNEHMNRHRTGDPDLIAREPSIYMSMIETAELVAQRYGVSREAQDAYALQSQQRTAQAQSEGRFDAEIMPVTTNMKIVDKETGESRDREITLERDEGNRPQTRLEDLAKLSPRLQGRPAGEAGSVRHGRQRLTALRRGGGGRAHGSARGGAQGAGAARRLPRPGRRRGARPTRWASAPYSRCRSSSSGTGSPWTTSICGS